MLKIFHYMNIIIKFQVQETITTTTTNILLLSVNVTDDSHHSPFLRLGSMPSLSHLPLTLLMLITWLLAYRNTQVCRICGTSTWWWLHRKTITADMEPSKRLPRTNLSLPVSRIYLRNNTLGDQHCCKSESGIWLSPSESKHALWSGDAAPAICRESSLLYVCWR